MTIYRSMDGADVEVTGDGRTLRGILVPWNVEVPVPNEGLRSEQFQRGAFNDQVRAFGRSQAPRIPLGRGHMGLNAELGGVLIGSVSNLRDDTAGLYGEARVAPTTVGNDTLALVNDGALDQLSIGFEPIQDLWTGADTVVRQRASATELAVVMSGAYGDAARIESVRARLACPTCAARVRDAGPSATALATELASLTQDAEDDPTLTPAVAQLASALAELVEPEADDVEMTEDMNGEEMA